MNRQTRAFALELEKLGGITGTAYRALKGAGKLVGRNKLRTLGAAMIAVPTVMAYRSARATGMDEGTGGGKYLAATRHRPSDAAYTNFHDLIEHAPSAREAKAVSRNYRPNAYRTVK